jgi:hypothetical protein
MLADTLKASIAQIKTERSERTTLEARLLEDMRLAALNLQDALREAGLTGANVEALTHIAGRANPTHAATGAQAANGQEIRLVVAIRRSPSTAYDHGRELLALRWRPAQEPDDEDDEGSREGWAPFDKLDERHETALRAVKAALARAPVARRVAEALIELGA